MASIGILPVERVTLQRLLINVECVYETGTTPTSFEEVFCYHTLITRIEDFFKIQHFDLLEPLAEKISRLCFEDKKVLETKVKLEKLDILPQTRSVGLQIIRSR